MGTATATAVDVMSWIYEHTKGVKVGASESAKHSNNHELKFRPPVLINAGNRSYELQADTEVVVYRKLHKLPNGSFGPRSNLTLATIFLKRYGLVDKQITIYMDGRVVVTPIRN